MCKTTKGRPSPVGPISIEAPAVLVSIQPLALSVVDAARVVGCTEFAIADAIRAGRLSAKKAGRHYVILITELQKWLTSLDPAIAA
jgi:excisionase family DNA binding protein